MRRTLQQQYETIRDAIAYLRAHARENPSAADVARAVGMSASRLEHAFAAWTGTTPKRFLAHLAKRRARKLLDASEDVTRAAARAGLSGAGSLHDLMVTYEALTPGEYKAGAEVRYGIHPSPFGWCVIGITRRGVCELSFLDDDDDDLARTAILEHWAKARPVRDDRATREAARKAFAGLEGGKPLHLVLHGTNFQVKVWEALLRIPQGAIVDYATLARMAGKPDAIRAAASACGRNAIAYLIPCHRVLARDGGLGGYRWGLERKEAMLVREL